MIDVYAVLSYFIILAVTLALFHFLPTSLGITRTSSSQLRYASIDGLRGYLAIGVALSHLISTRKFITTGEWGGVINNFHSFLGQGSVALFFVITGFLFWGKLLRSGTRTDWLDLYIGRIFRIAPMYLVVVSIMLLIVAARTGFALREPLRDVAHEVAAWLALGILDQPLTINGYPKANLIVAGVTWTLHWEWLFYASLPLLAVFSRPKVRLVFPIVGLIGCLLLAAFTPHRVVTIFAALFLVGMSTASLHHSGYRPRIPDWVSSSLAAACLIAAVIVSPYPLSALPVVFYAGFFYLVSSGSTLFGVLTNRAALSLGDASYSIYLTQGLFLTSAFSLPLVREFAFAGPVQFWLTGAVYIIVLSLSASVCFKFVERPYILFGKKLRPAMPFTSTQDQPSQTNQGKRAALDP
jgi:peptidoglycan/LPS O-acetylase OafA/YrhL